MPCLSGTGWAKAGCATLTDNWSKNLTAAAIEIVGLED